jgi:hypothetical protein
MCDCFCPLFFSLLPRGRTLPVMCDLSHALQTARPRPIFYEHRESRREPPKSPSADIHLYGCASDQIFGEHIRDSSCDPFDPPLLLLHPVLRRLPRATRAIVFVSATIQGIVRCTSSCIEFVWLHRTYTRDVSCEWSH